MRNNFKIVLALLLCLTVFTACNKETESSKPAEKPVETTAENNESSTESQTETQFEVEEEVSLADWEGMWNSIEGYLDEEEVQGAFDSLATENNTSAEEAKEAYKEKRHADFLGMKIEGETVTFLDGFEDKGGNAIETTSYKYLGQHNIKHGNFDLEWFTFEAEGESKYPILLMMSVHGEEDLIHFHMRYGASEAELLEKEGWYPTFVKPNSTLDQVADEIAE